MGQGTDLLYSGPIAASADQRVQTGEPHQVRYIHVIVGCEGKNQAGQWGLQLRQRIAPGFCESKLLKVVHGC